MREVTEDHGILAVPFDRTVPHAVARERNDPHAKGDHVQELAQEITQMYAEHHSEELRANVKWKGETDD